MIVRCSRCGRPAGVVMTFNYGERRVWLDDFAGEEVVTPGYAMCEAHADRLTPPQGWTLTDLRRPLRPLFVSRDVA